MIAQTYQMDLPVYVFVVKFYIYFIDIVTAAFSVKI